MQDRPTSAELIQAVRDALERDVAPRLSDPRARYIALISANVLRIVERELLGEDVRLAAELAALDALLERERNAGPASLAALREAVREGNRGLCERIRLGDGDHGPWRERLLVHLRATVAARLAVDNPAEL